MSGFSQFIPLPLSASSGGFGISQARTAITTTGTINNQALTTGWLDFTGTSSVTLTGIVAATEGTRIKLSNNLGASNRYLTLSNNSGSSSAANRFNIGRNYTVRSTQSVNLIYRSGAWVLDDTALNSWNVDGNYLPSSGTYTFGTVSGSSATSMSFVFGGTKFMDIAGADRVLYNNAGTEAVRFDLATGFYLKNYYGFIVVDWGQARLKSPTSGNSTVDWSSCELFEPVNGFSSANWSSMQMHDYNTSYVSLDWHYRTGYDEYGYQSISYGYSRSLYDSVGSYSISWQDRYLWASGGYLSVSWESRTLYDGSGYYSSLNWSNRYLYDSMSVVCMDWNYRTCYDTGLYYSFDWNSRYLYRTNGVLTMDYGNGYFYDIGGSNITIDWINSQLMNSTYAIIDWSLQTMKNASGQAIANWNNAAWVFEGASTSVDGAVWYSTTQKGLMSYQDNITQSLSGTIFTQTATVTVANTVTETEITSSTGIGSKSLPANFFVAGKTIRIKGRGYHSTSGTPTLRVKLYLGSTTILDTGVQTSTAASNDGFMFEADITCRTTGASGTVMAQGMYAEKLTSAGAINHFAWTNTATTTLDTTATKILSVKVTWGTASSSNTISLTNFTVEVLN